MDTAAHTNTGRLRPFSCLRHKPPRRPCARSRRWGTWSVPSSRRPSSLPLSPCPGVCFSPPRTPQTDFPNTSHASVGSGPSASVPWGRSQPLSTRGPCSGLCGHCPSPRALCSPSAPACPAAPAAQPYRSPLECLRVPSGPSSAPGSCSLSPRCAGTRAPCALPALRRAGRARTVQGAVVGAGATG